MAQPAVAFWDVQRHNDVLTHKRFGIVDSENQTRLLPTDWIPTGMFQMASSSLYYMTDRALKWGLVLDNDVLVAAFEWDDYALRKSRSAIIGYSLSAQQVVFTWDAISASIYRPIAVAGDQYVVLVQTALNPDGWSGPYEMVLYRLTSGGPEQIGAKFIRQEQSYFPILRDTLSWSERRGSGSLCGALVGGGLCWVSLGHEVVRRIDLTTGEESTVFVDEATYWAANYTVILRDPPQTPVPLVRPRDALPLHSWRAVNNYGGKTWGRLASQWNSDGYIPGREPIYLADAQGRLAVSYWGGPWPNRPTPPVFPQVLDVPNYPGSHPAGITELDTAARRILMLSLGTGKTQFWRNFVNTREVRP